MQVFEQAKDLLLVLFCEPYPVIFYLDRNHVTAVRTCNTTMRRNSFSGVLQRIRNEVNQELS